MPKSWRQPTFSFVSFPLLVFSFLAPPIRFPFYVSTITWQGGSRCASLLSRRFPPHFHSCTLFPHNTFEIHRCSCRIFFSSEETAMTKLGERIASYDTNCKELNCGSCSKFLKTESFAYLFLLFSSSPLPLVGGDISFLSPETKVRMSSFVPFLFLTPRMQR